MLNKMYSLDDQNDQQPCLLKEPSQFIPTLLDASDIECFIFSMSNEGVIEYASDSVESMLGFSAQEMVGKEFATFLSSNPKNDLVQKGCWKTIPANSTAKCRCELQSKSQNLISVKMLNLGVYDDDSMIGIVGMVQRDATLEGALADSKTEERERLRQLATQLSPTEREVVALVVEGHMNKSMSKMLGVAVRTIEARRARAMAKLQARSLPELVKIWLLISED